MLPLPTGRQARAGIDVHVLPAPSPGTNPSLAGFFNNLGREKGFYSS
jgi:hypothetical protein